MEHNNETQANADERKLVITVDVLDATGHTTLMLSPTETEQYISNQEESSWIFVDGYLVSKDQMPKVNWSEAQNVRVSPGLVGGENPSGLGHLGLTIRQDGV